MSNARKRTTRTRAAGANADMESNLGDAPLGAKKAPRFTAPVCITVTHLRKRLADPDGLSVKAVLDGLVIAGILDDDSAQQVTEVRHTQVKAGREETRIVIELA